MLATDLIMKLVGLAVLTPLVSLSFNAFLSFSGRSVLADMDIAFFLLHPIGWGAAIVAGGGALAILALEQAALMSIVLSASVGHRIGVISSLRFAASRARVIYSIAWRMVARVLLVASPFLVASGAVYAIFLTKHDINYYLADKPPAFWVAAILIGSLMGGVVLLLLRLVSGWAFVLQLLLFEGTAPRECLRASNRLAAGQRIRIVKWIGGWIVCNTAASTLATSIVIVLGQLAVRLSSASLWRAILAIGAVLVAWSLLNLVANSLAVISLSSVLVRLYSTTRTVQALPPALAQPGLGRLTIQMTGGRIAAILTVGCIAALLVGADAVHGLRLEDAVEITAHRGASGKAPENTLAAINQAIEDGTDWIEIDVQESQDGVVVVVHDRDLKRVSGADANVWETNASELQAIDVGSHFAPRFANERVPTLAEVLVACQGRAKVNIELKYYGHDQQLERRVIDIIEQHGMQPDTVIMSLEPGGIRKVKQLRPTWSVGLLTAVAVGDLTRTEADFFAISTKLATPRFIQSAHRKQKQVSVWTVNDPIMMSVMISRGVDNIITDYPDIARRVLVERAAMSPVERMALELAVVLGARPATAPSAQ